MRRPNDRPKREPGLVGIPTRRHMAGRLRTGYRRPERRASPAPHRGACRTSPSMTTRRWWLVGGALAVGAASLAIVHAGRFYGHLDTLRRAVVQPPARHPTARTDLPAEVAELALRLGAEPGAATVELRQDGQMWSSPGARPMRFKARQTAATARLEYIWNADLGPGGLVKAADYYVAGTGGLEVKAAGLLTLAREVGTSEIAQGEVLRYLAELPWNPDAILVNRSLDWAVVGPSTLRVSHADAAITFVLGPDGLPESMSAPGRVYLGKEGARLVPWGGRFGRYERMGGRLLPTLGEVAWILDGREFVYWRGRLTAWSAFPAAAE
jgi:hypothetical protein